MMLLRYAGLAMFCWALILVFAQSSSGKTGSEILSETGIESGVCITVGASDGVLETELAENGGLHIQGLSTIDADIEKSRLFIVSRGLYGVAAIRKVTSYALLPYRSNQVNLVIADLDVLGNNAPAKAELLRVTAPFGALYTKSSGQWRLERKPLPGGMDEWPQYFHSADMNPVSKDALVEPSSSVNWISGRFEMGASHNSNSGVLIAQGKAVTAFKSTNLASGQRARLVIRDAFNGVITWMRDISNDLTKQSLMIGDSTVYAAIDNEGYLHGLDLNTGAIRMKYTKGGKAENQYNSDIRHLLTIAHDGMLIQTALDTIYVLDARTGALKWKAAETKRVFYPVANGNQLFVAVGPDRYSTWRSPINTVDYVACYDLRTGGSALWKAQFGGAKVGQIVYSEGRLHAMGWKGIGSGDGTTDYWSVRASDGTILFKKDYFADTKDSGPAIVLGVRNNALQIGNIGGFAEYDPETGTLVTNSFTPGIPKISSYQCNASRFTEKYVLSYSIIFTDNAKNSTRSLLSRSTCGTGVFPAYGMVYTTTNYCGCHSMLRGNMALGSDKLGEVVDDTRRLENGPGIIASPTTGNWPVQEEWPMFLGNSRRSSAGSALDQGKPVWSVSLGQSASAPSGIKVDWTENDIYLGPVTPPVVADSIVAVALPDEHTVVAVNANTGVRKWEFVAGGRVDGAPLLYKSMCIFGCRDGYVYGVNSSNGRLAWKFLAAPNHLSTVAYSQFESAWPVYAPVMLHQGSVYVSAGRHPQAEGGLFFYKLHPFTGALLAKSVYSTEKDSIPRASAGCTNDILSSDGKLLFIQGVALHPSTMEAVPAGARAMFPAAGADSVGWRLRCTMGLSFRRARATFRNGAVHYGQSNLEATKWAVHDTDVFAIKANVWNTNTTTPFLAKWPAQSLVGNAIGKIPIWRNDSMPKTHDVSALAIAGNQVVVGGEDNAKKGFIRLYSGTDGKLLKTLTLPASRIVENGIAVAYGRIYCTTEDGKLMSLSGSDMLPVSVKSAVETARDPSVGRAFLKAAKAAITR